MRTLALLLAFAFALPFVAAAGTTHTIQAANTGYTAPAVVIASGDSVAWHSTDDTHVTIDTPVLGGDPCFSALSQGDGTSDPVRFDIVAGALVATQDGLSTTCPSAVVTPGGAALAYHCAIHPLMRGALVVTP